MNHFWELIAMVSILSAMKAVASWRDEKKWLHLYDQKAPPKN